MTANKFAVNIPDWTH